jgi:ferredoxin
VESKPERLVRLTVDQGVCIGAGACEMLEAEVFLLDEDTNIAGVIGDGRLPLGRAQVVIDRCPSSAISIMAREA